MQVGLVGLFRERSDSSVDDSSNAGYIGMHTVDRIENTTLVWNKSLDGFCFVLLIDQIIPIVVSKVFWIQLFLTLVGDN